MQHILSLRADKIRREREEHQKKKREVRASLTQPLASVSDKALVEMIKRRSAQGKPVRKLVRALEERLAVIEGQQGAEEKEGEQST